MIKLLWGTLLALLLVGAALWLVAWLSWLPLPDRPSPAPVTIGAAAQPGPAAVPDSVLGRAVAPLTAAHAPLDGIHALANGRDAFMARAVLADAAQHSIDALYYIWHDDTAGRLLLQRLLLAADRGVKVRLLLDDNNTQGLDALLLGLDAHPHMELRLFNPLLHRQARALDYLSDFARVNRRMHNKSFTVDGQATVVGGRNVGDEYFGAGDGVLFVDLDVLAIGPVVQHVGTDFERYWQSASVYPISAVAGTSPFRSLSPQTATDEATQQYLTTLRASTLLTQLQAGDLPLQWATSRLVSDDPAKGLGLAQRSDLVLTQLSQALAAAHKEVAIVSPYFVPSQAGTEALVRLAQRGVTVSVLTNALSATDVTAVHAGYAKYRPALLRGGVKLYELKREAPALERHHAGLRGSSGASLHAKTFAIDRQTVFVGSFNMDPRSALLNTEMGLLIDSAPLASQLTQALTAPDLQRVYAVSLVGKELQWTSLEDGHTVTHTQEPLASIWRRAWVSMLSMLPLEWML